MVRATRTILFLTAILLININIISKTHAQEYLQIAPEAMAIIEELERRHNPTLRQPSSYQTHTISPDQRLYQSNKARIDSVNDLLDFVEAEIYQPAEPNPMLKQQNRPVREMAPVQPLEVVEPDEEVFIQDIPAEDFQDDMMLMQEVNMGADVQMSDEDLLNQVAMGNVASDNVSTGAKSDNQSFSGANEMALFQEIPMVISASKKLQPITQAPASVYVVTNEDIKQTPSIHLWDALRQVPGMDVNYATIGQGEVSMRGFADLGSNKTLLMVDGRPQYYPMQGLQLWEALPIQFEEIERIEVVKGPVASLYGANANLGLINVITSTADQIDGFKASATKGTAENNRYSFVYGQDFGELDFKVSGGYKFANTNSKGFNRGRDALETKTGNVVVGYDISDDSKFRWSSGVSEVYNFLYFDQTGIDENTALIARGFYGRFHSQQIYMQGDYNKGDWNTKLIWDHNNTKFETSALEVRVRGDSFLLDTNYGFDIGNWHSFVVGFGGKLHLIDSNLFAEEEAFEQHEGNFNIYVQDEIKLHEKFSVTASARMDQTRLTGYQPSLRVAGVFTPSKNDVFRLAAGYSFRNPTFSDTYTDLSVVDLGPVLGVLCGWDLCIDIVGNESLQPENYLTYEASYQGVKLDGRFRPFVDLFFTKITDFIEFEPATTGSLCFFNACDVNFTNTGTGISIGGEAGGEYDLNKHFTLIGSYAQNAVSYNDVVDEKYFPAERKFIAGYKTKWFNDRLKSKFLTHWVWPTRTTFRTRNLNRLDRSTKSYVMGNFWIGYEFTKNLEVSFSGFNVFNNKHVEIEGGDEVGMKWLGSIDLTF